LSEKSTKIKMKNYKKQGKMLENEAEEGAQMID